MVHSLYFSPTGGVKKVLNEICEGFELESQVDLTARHDYANYSFDRDDLVFIAVPCFAGRVPGVALGRLGRMNVAGASAVLVLVYGNRAYDDALLELYDVVKAYGFRPLAAIAAIAEHSIIRSIATGRPDEEDRQELRRYGERIRELLSQGTEEQELNLPGQKPYKEYKGLPFLPKANSSCSKCGICALACPVNAIQEHAPAVPDKAQCLVCMRCVSICPQKARRIALIPRFMVGRMLSKVCAERRKNELFA